MNVTPLSQKMIDKLKKHASKATIFDRAEDAIVYDFVGSNIDDAYELGSSDGKTNIARSILADMHIAWPRD